MNPWRHLAQTTPFPIGIPIASASGHLLYDTAGNAYMDLVSGIGVSHIGHSHPKVIKAICEQAEKHLHVMVYGEFVQSPQVRFAEKLCTLLPESLDSVYFTNSGAEAIEAAMKLAKRATGRPNLIALQRSYHGSTHGALSITGNENKKYAFRPLLPGIRFIAQNDPDSLNRIDQTTAAVFVETIQGDAGIRIPEQSWLQALRKRCTETGTLLVMDEIQCGMGRTGKWFAFEHFGITPDILVLGKALGGGLPIGACVASRDLMKLFTYDPMLGHITTFGGHPLPCAAGMAALEVLEGTDWIEKANGKGQVLATTITAHPLVKEVRQIGLFMAVDLNTATEVGQFIDRLQSLGAIAFRFLSAPYSFRLAPPLCMSDHDLREAGKRILQALDQLQSPLR